MYMYMMRGRHPLFGALLLGAWMLLALLYVRWISPRPTREGFQGTDPGPHAVLYSENNYQGQSIALPLQERVGASFLGLVTQLSSVNVPPGYLIRIAFRTPAGAHVFKELTGRTDFLGLSLGTDSGFEYLELVPQSAPRCFLQEGEVVIHPSTRQKARIEGGKLRVFDDEDAYATWNAPRAREVRESDWDACPVGAPIGARCPFLEGQLIRTATQSGRIEDGKVRLFADAEARLYHGVQDASLQEVTTWSPCVLHPKPPLRANAYERIPEKRVPPYAVLLPARAADTVEACEAACNAKDNCRGFVWNPQDPVRCSLTDVPPSEWQSGFLGLGDGTLYRRRLCQVQEEQILEIPSDPVLWKVENGQLVAVQEVNTHERSIEILLVPRAEYPALPEAGWDELQLQHVDEDPAVFFQTGTNLLYARRNGRWSLRYLPDTWIQTPRPKKPTPPRFAISINQEDPVPVQPDSRIFAQRGDSLQLFVYAPKGVARTLTGRLELLFIPSMVDQVQRVSAETVEGCTRVGALPISNVPSAATPTDSQG